MPSKGQKKERARRTSTQPKTSAIKTSAFTAPTFEQVQLRAYHIFLARGGQPGREVDDWLQAESELQPR